MSIERLMALENAVELVAKATPGPWMVSDHNEGEMHPLWCVDNEAFHTGGDEDQPLMVSVQYGGKEDAEAIRAAVNFIREHGSALIAELGQEVGAVAPVSFAVELADGTLGALGWIDYAKFEHVKNMGTLANGARYVFAYRTSPAHTSEARDAARYRWLRDSQDLNGPRITTWNEAMGEPLYPSPKLADEEIDAAMRQEAE